MLLLVKQTRSKMSQINSTLEMKLHKIARILGVAACNSLVIAADAVRPNVAGTPHPQAFTPAPVPSSFVLVIAGFAALFGWKWWRSRSHLKQAARD